MESNKNEIDELLRNQLGDYKIPFDESYWEEAQKGIKKKKSNNRFGYILLSSLAVGLVALGAFIMLFDKNQALQVYSERTIVIADEDDEYENIQNLTQSINELNTPTPTPTPTVNKKYSPIQPTNKVTKLQTAENLTTNKVNRNSSPLINTTPPTLEKKASIAENSEMEINNTPITTPQDNSNTKPEFGQNLGNISGVSKKEEFDQEDRQIANQGITLSDELQNLATKEINLDHSINSSLSPFQTFKEKPTIALNSHENNPKLTLAPIHFLGFTPPSDQTIIPLAIQPKSTFIDRKTQLFAHIGYATSTLSTKDVGITTTKAYETSYGLEVHLPFKNSNWGIYAGINQNIFRESLEYDLITFENQLVNHSIGGWERQDYKRYVFDTTWVQGIAFVNGGYLDVSDSTYNPHQDSITQIKKIANDSIVKESNRIEYIEFPIMLSYSKSIHKWNIMVVTGPSFGRVLKANGSIRDPYDVTNSYQYSDNSQFNELLINYNFRLKVVYNVNSRFGIYTEPHLKMNTNSLLNNKTNQSRRYNHYGVRAGLMFHF